MAFDKCFTAPSSFPASKSLKNLCISLIAESGTFSASTETIPPGASPGLAPAKLLSARVAITHCSSEASVARGEICVGLVLKPSTERCARPKAQLHRRKSAAHTVRFIVASRAPDHSTRLTAPRVSWPPQPPCFRPAPAKQPFQTLESQYVGRHPDTRGPSTLMARSTRWHSGSVRCYDALLISLLLRSARLGSASLPNKTLPGFTGQVSPG